MVMLEFIKVGKIVKVFFQYPNVNHIIVKSGKVLSVDKEGFVLDEVRDGKSAYAFTYLVEARAA